MHLEFIKIRSRNITKNKIDYIQIQHDINLKLSNIKNEHKGKKLSKCLFYRLYKNVKNPNWLSNINKILYANQLKFNDLSDQICLI